MTYHPMCCQPVLEVFQFLSLTGGAFVLLTALGTFDQVLIYAPLLEDNLVTSIDIEVPKTPREVGGKFSVRFVRFVPAFFC